MIASMLKRRSPFRERSPPPLRSARAQRTMRSQRRASGRSCRHRVSSVVPALAMNAKTRSAIWAPPVGVEIACRLVGANDDGSGARRARRRPVAARPRKARPVMSEAIAEADSRAIPRPPAQSIVRPASSSTRRFPAPSSSGSDGRIGRRCRFPAPELGQASSSSTTSPGHRSPPCRHRPVRGPPSP